MVQILLINRMGLLVSLGEGTATWKAYSTLVEGRRTVKGSCCFSKVQGLGQQLRRYVHKPVRIKNRVQVIAGIQEAAHATRKKGMSSKWIHKRKPL